MRMDGQACRDSHIQERRLTAGRQQPARAMAIGSQTRTQSIGRAWAAVRACTPLPRSAGWRAGSAGPRGWRSRTGGCPTACGSRARPRRSSCPTAPAQSRSLRSRCMHFTIYSRTSIGFQNHCDRLPSMKFGSTQTRFFTSPVKLPAKLGCRRDCSAWRTVGRVRGEQPEGTRACAHGSAGACKCLGLGFRVSPQAH